MLAEIAREEEVHAKAQLAKAKKERACRLLAGLANRHLKAGFEDLAVEVRHLRRERLAFRLADLDSRKAPEVWAMQDQRKAAAEYAERLKCPKFREEMDLERIAKEKENQAANVAFHAAEKEKKRRHERAEGQKTERHGTASHERGPRKAACRGPPEEQTEPRQTKRST